jgi:hypothetical protein
MSIALQEAKNYQACAGDCMGSDEAYYAGRTAEPTEAEIEAMARLEAQEEAEDGFGEPWDCMVEEDQEAFRANAKRMLMAARKAVSVDE